MANSLLTGISGLRGHQKMLEVVGNNLANMNTTAFKSARTVFSDLMYETQRGAMSANAGVLGSVNALQIGTGSRVSLVDLNYTQGNLEATGQELDMALDGNGFFVVKSADKTFYTRAGAFSLDESGYLVDASTGNTVQRFGTVGEPNGTKPAFQTPGDDRILIPKGTSIPGSISTGIDVSGNFPSTATGPVAQQLRTAAPLTVGGTAATSATLLNDLDMNLTPYGGTDQLLFGGGGPTGSAPSPSTFAVGATTTVGDLLAAMDAAYANTSFALDASGHIQVADDQTGPSSLTISINDAPGNSGSSDFASHELVRTAIGKHADEFFRAVEVFDERGVGHNVNLKFTKQADGISWNMEALIDPTEGILVDRFVNGIRFNTNGSFQQVTGTAEGDDDITIQFNTVGTQQNIKLSFGSPGSFDGLSEVGTKASLNAVADGYEPGELASVQVDVDGTLFGLSSNGLMIELGQLAIATFRNVDGLVSVGNNYYDASVASGGAQIGGGITGDRGAVRSGQLEGSNVDLALEFTRLIVAQRGFSANARTITVTDEVLKELTNLIR